MTVRAYRAAFMAGVLLATGPPVRGQAPAPAAPAADVVAEAFRRLGEGRYLDAIETVRPAAATGAEPAASFFRQIEPYLTGVPAMPAETPDAAAPAPASGLWARAERRDAIAAIVERARRTSIVIVNEAHDTPRHRAFALEVARALRPLGYAILAAETFSNTPDAAASAAAMAALARDGYPRRNSGVYLMDPVFADFIRQALALGYRPVAYEQTGGGPSGSREERIVAREEAQARNLVERIFAATPGARVLIHVGYSHATEAPLPDESGARIEWMAARLKRLTGIDPLTIDQTAVTEYDAVRRADYDAAAARAGASPAVFMVDGAPLVIGRYAGAVDLQVIHPRTRMVNGRPDWLRSMGRAATAIPQDLLPRNGRRLIQAFVAGEAADAIPVDQVVAEAGRPPPSLMLPPVPIRFAHQDPSPGGAN